MAVLMSRVPLNSMTFSIFMVFYAIMHMLVLNIFDVLLDWVLVMMTMTMTVVTTVVTMSMSMMSVRPVEGISGRNYMARAAWIAEGITVVMMSLVSGFISGTVSGIVRG